MSVTLSWAPCKLAKHLEQRRQVALFVAQGPRDGEQLVGYRGGWQRDAQLSPCVKRKRDILLHQADVDQASSGRSSTSAARAFSIGEPIALPLIT